MNKVNMNVLQAKLQLHGVVSRGVKRAEIDENGDLIFTMTDNTTVNLGRVVGDDGVDIVSVTYVRTAAMYIP